VWLAEHTRLDRPVALKVIRPALLANPGAVERFGRETRAVARLRHDNIVAAYDADSAGGTHFLVMEYVDGPTLAELAAAGPLPAEACRAVRDAARGLAHAHAAGLVHRDVKPQTHAVLQSRRDAPSDPALPFPRPVGHSGGPGALNTHCGPRRPPSAGLRCGGETRSATAGGLRCGAYESPVLAKAGRTVFEHRRAFRFWPDLRRARPAVGASGRGSGPRGDRPLPAARRAARAGVPRPRLDRRKGFADPPKPGEITAPRKNRVRIRAAARYLR
jgi:hypothetical protein